jgi:hypothetical protein
MNSMRYISLFFLFIFFPLALVSAQSSNMIYGDEALTIDLKPQYPNPGETFTATVNDYSLPVQGAGIRWYVDGELLAEAKNDRSLELTAKKSGEETTLKLILDLPSGETISAEKIILPTYLDIIIEPQTRTPAFYKGRGLPSLGSLVNATALLDGNTIDPNTVLYLWRVNNDVLEGGAVRGKNQVSFTMPRGESATLSLEARRPSGETITRRTFTLNSVSPTLSFYETNPLYGLATKAIRDSIVLVGNSVSVRAEPYYLDLRTYNSPDLLEWEVNNTPGDTGGSNPYEVTLAASGLGGASVVDFHVRNLKQVLQGAQGSFAVTD